MRNQEILHEKETLLLGRSLIDRYQASSLGNTCSLIGREYTLELRPGNVDEEPLLISLEKNTWTLNIGDGNESETWKSNHKIYLRDSQ